MKKWPEINFLDDTYKLLDTDLTVFLIIVEDSNSIGHVVGVGLLANEQTNTMKWFFEKFKSYHLEACAILNAQ